MKLLIFEPEGGGHRLTYVRQMLGALEGRENIEPVLLLGEAVTRRDEYPVQIGPWEDRVRVVTRPIVPEADFAHWIAALTSAIADEKPDRVLIPSADGLAQKLTLSPKALAGVEHTDLVVHSAGFAFSSPTMKQTLKRRLSLALLGRAPGTRVRFVNGLAIDWLESRRHRLASRATVLPDPVDVVGASDKHTSLKALGLTSDEPLLVSGGQQNARKGVHHLVRSFDAWVQRKQGPGRLVLVGKRDDEVRAAQDAMSPEGAERVTFMDRYVTDEELQHALAGADVVANCSPFHVGLSNIALRAAAAERPVLAGNRGWLGEMVPRHRLGWCADPLDVEAFADAIGASLAGAASWTPTDQSKRLVAFHAPSNFRATVRSWYADEEPEMDWHQLRGA